MSKPAEPDLNFEEFSKENRDLNCEQLKREFENHEDAYKNKSKIVENAIEPINTWTEKHIRAWLGVFIGSNCSNYTNSNKEFLLSEIISIVRRVVFLTFRFELRGVQLLSITALLNKKPNKGRLLQVATGEGKSVTIAVLAAIKVLLGERYVDIVTSSEVLAQRDSKELKKFYDMLQISVSNNIDEKNCEKAKDCYKCNVIYGSAYSFQVDILFDEYKGKNTLAGRKPEAIIIDEVDNMFIDEYSRSTYLSTAKPGLEKLNFVFYVIWKHLEVLNENECKNKETLEQIKDVIDVYLNKDQMNEEDPTPILNVPDYLKQFIIINLENWVQKAISAKFHIKEGNDYLIENGDIKPIDQENTGKIQTNTKYSNGLHQFLQIKHRLKMTDFSLITNYLSNIGFFKRYISKDKEVNKICGLTGTLGSGNCKQMLDDVYSVDFVHIPTFQPRKFIELDSVIKENESEWLEAISDSVLEKVGNMRAVLVLAESINYVDKIYDKLREKVNTIIVYKRDDIDKLPEQKLEPEKVIISTNLAGRGVDIKLDDSVIKNGGLHVCLSFLSINSRVQMQAFGRAARQGEPGSGQLILNYEKLVQLTNLNSQQAKEIRRNREVLFMYEETLELMSQEMLDFILGIPENIEDFKALRNEREKKLMEKSKILIDRICIEDMLFEKFCSLLKDIKDPQKFHFKEFEENLIRNAIEERWAIWLINLKKDLPREEVLCCLNDFKASILNDLNNKENNYKVIQNSHYIDQLCFTSLRGKESKWIKILRDPLTKLKTLFNKNEEYSILSDDCIVKLCDDSIKKNPSSFVPYMNKAVCLINKENESNEEINYENASKEYESSAKMNRREIIFWSNFQYMLQNDIFKNEETIKLVEKKVCLLNKIHNGIIENNKKEIESAKKEKRKVNLIEIDIKGLLSCKEEINEMRLKGLESVFTINKQVRTLDLAILFALSTAQIGVGIGLLFTPAAAIGCGLFYEGIWDLFSCSNAIITREFSWKEYGIKKLISCAFTGLFAGLGSIKLLKIKGIYNFLKKLPLTHAKEFIKQKFGYEIKAIALKLTGNIYKDSILMSISFLSRKLYNKNKKLSKKNLKYDETVTKINRNIKAKLQEVNQKYIERANEIEQRFENEVDNQLNDDVSDILAHITEESLDDVIQRSALEILTKQNETTLQHVIENTIENIKDGILENIYAQKADAWKIDKIDDKEKLSQTIEKAVAKNTIKSAEQFKEKLKLEQRTLSIRDKLIQKIEDPRFANKKSELIKKKNEFEQNCTIIKQKIGQYIKSRNKAQDLIDAAKNKYKSEITANLMNQMKEEMNIKMNDRQVQLNAYTSNGDPNYKYTSLDIEYISTQLFKEYVLASDMLLLKPINKDSLERTLGKIKLQKYNMLFYDVGDLKWDVFFIVKQEAQIDVLCKSLLKADANSNESIDLIKSVLERNCSDLQFKFYMNQRHLNETNELVQAATGIHSLWNMKMIADEIIKNDRLEGLLRDFQTYEHWCMQDLTLSLRINEFAELFAINFLEVEFERFILIDKEDLIKEHHKSQLNDLTSLLENMTSVQNIQFALAESASKEGLNNPVLVELHVDSVCANGQTNIVDYEYSYLLNFDKVKDKSLKKTIKDEICIFYSLAEIESDSVRIPARNNTNNCINVRDKLKISLYEQVNNDDQEAEVAEDSIFCVENFLLILANLECENLSLNEKLASKLFKKTKFYDGTNRISDSFYKITRILTETHKLMRSEMKMLEKAASDKDKHVADASESLELEELNEQSEKKRQNIINILKNSNIPITDELVESLINS